MKFELEIIKFNVMDVITTSADECPEPPFMPLD